MYWHWQSVDGVYVCVAYSSEYKIINMDTGHVQELFSFDSGHVLPTITKISRVSFSVCYEVLCYYLHTTWGDMPHVGPGL